MMLAVMYGMMPSANTDSRYSAPPLNRLTSWNRLVLLVLTRLRQESTAFSEIPGVGSEAPSRNMAMMKIVNSSFLRRSGVRKARTNAVSMPRTSGRCVDVIYRSSLRVGAHWLQAATPAPQSSSPRAVQQPCAKPGPRAYCGPRQPGRLRMSG